MYIKISNITCNDFYIEYDESMRQFIQVGSALQCSSTNNGTYYICIIAIIYGNINSLFIFVNYEGHQGKGFLYGISTSRFFNTSNTCYLNV